MRKFLVYLKLASRWIGADGIQHIAVCCIATFALAAFLPIWGAMLAALAIGIGKEVYDLAQNGWDVRTYDWKHSGHDMVCDCIGIVFGALIALVWLAINK